MSALGFQAVTVMSMTYQSAPANDSSVVDEGGGQQRRRRRRKRGLPDQIGVKVSAIVQFSKAGVSLQDYQTAFSSLTSSDLTLGDGLRIDPSFNEVQGTALQTDQITAYYSSKTFMIIVRAHRRYYVDLHFELHSSKNKKYISMVDSGHQLHSLDSSLQN